MIFQNLHLIDYDERQHIRTTGNAITCIMSGEAFLKPGPGERSVELENAFAFPGLINSHDHLEFNLFPRAGNRLYANYMEWGPDIHVHQKDIIDAILKIPLELRVQWGIYKNLLNGITTVVHHGRSLAVTDPLITVFQDCDSLHSLGTERWWKYKLNMPPAKSKPLVVHIGEGTDDAAAKEIDELIRWNIFKRKLIGVHAVAMNKEQAKAFEALVWCPDSNLFLLGTTAAVNELGKETKILFGTDSTLSASWNIWEHIRLAKKTGLLSDVELLDSLTRTPASVWDLSGGILAEGKSADIVFAKMKNGSALDSFFSTTPEDILLVVRRGDIILSDESVFDRLNFTQREKETFSKIAINNSSKYVKGDLPALVRAIQSYNTGSISFLQEAMLNIF